MSRSQTPPGGVSQYHFDLTVTVYEDGSSIAVLTDPGTFDGVVARGWGDTAEQALSALSAKVLIHDVTHTG